MNRNAGSLVQSLFDIVAQVIKILLWPVRTFTTILAPPGEYDGLSPAVTEKAAQQFIYYLRSLSTSVEQSSLIDQVFSSTGFASVKEEASQSNAIIVVYLHSPLHSQAKVMAQKLISAPMLSFLNRDHLKTIGVSIHTSQGAQLAQNLGAASFPLLAMLQQSPSSRSGPLQMVFKAEGPNFLKTSISQLTPLMQGTLRNHEMIIAENEARRIVREQEQELRRQQDDEYQESLRADQERENQRLEEIRREEQVRLETEEKEKEAARKEEELMDKAKQLIRPAPASGGTRVRFTLPTGKKLDRRFESDETIGTLKAFLHLHFIENDVDIKNIGLSSNFPKHDYTDDVITLQEAGLSPQAVLMVQDLDA